MRANATKHGLSASAPSSVLMPDEDADAFQELGTRLREALKPVVEVEELLAERITACAWRLKRIERVEAGSFVHGFLAKQAQDVEQEIARQSGFTEVLATVQGAPVSDPKYRETMAEHREMLAVQRKATGVEVAGFLQDAQTNNAFSKLSRYEAGLEHSLYKVLDELKRSQRLRRNETLTYTRGQGANAENIQQDVPILRTSCNYGGERLWWQCPECERRVAVIYGIGKYFACRRCGGLSYASQKEKPAHRALRRGKKTREILGQTTGGLAAPFPEKPRGMHLMTYHDLSVRCRADEAAYLKSLGTWLDAACDHGLKELEAYQKQVSKYSKGD